jgi:hypothetical protein
METTPGLARSTASAYEAVEETAARGSLAAALGGGTGVGGCLGFSSLLHATKTNRRTAHVNVFLISVLLS